jgi:hypothetical protein
MTPTSRAPQAANQVRSKKSVIFSYPLIIDD